MSTYTLHPTTLLSKDGGLEATADSGGTWAAASDTTATGAVNDSSDTTGIRADSSDMRWAQFALGTPSVAADEFIARVAGFLRWSHGTAGKYVGVQPYLAADTAPGYASTIVVDARTSPTTSEPGYQARAWTTAEVGALALQVQMQGDTTAANRPRLWEVGATLYALKLATATPHATTMAGTSYPTVPVDVAATIGWEADTPNWMGLRKITTEVWVESGGSGAGTGTLVSSAQVDTYFTATGTVTVDVALPDSLANGTYHVYARAIRHRENESTVASDQVGVWSSAATLTMTVSPPETPTVTLTVDDTLDQVHVIVTPTSHDYDAEQLLAAGALWLDARYATSAQTVANRGTTGSALDATRGSSGTADSNDPQWLPHDTSPYLYFPGSGANSASVPSAANLQITGDLTLIVKVNLDSVAPAGAASRFIGKRAANSEGYELTLRSTGVLELQWRDSGTGGWRSQQTSVSLATAGIAAGSTVYLAATLDADNGAAGHTVRFWWSTDGVTWTQIGADRTSGTVAAIVTGTNVVEIGARSGSSDPLAGRVYRAVIQSGIGTGGNPGNAGATTILDADFSTLTSGAAATHAAVTGQTITINRDTSGPKTVAVLANSWLLGTDDYFAVADNAALDFAAASSFSVVCSAREWPTPASGGALVAKRTTGQGYGLTQTTTTQGVTFTISDGVNSASAASPAATAGALRTYVAVVDRTAQTLTVYCDGVAGTPVSISSVGSLANAEDLRIGRLSGASTSYLDAEIHAAGVLPVALTAAQALTLATYFSTRAAVSDGYSSPYVTVERSLDGGTTWADVRDGTSIAAVFNTATTVIDYEAPRGTVVKYRARTAAYTSSVLNASLTSAAATATLLADTWNLKCPQAPALNLVDTAVTGDPSDGLSEDVGVFRPLDRQYPVTVAGTLGGWDGDLQIHCGTAAEWSALKDLIESQSVLYLESPFGWAKYIRILPSTVKTTMKGSASLPRRVVTLSYVETSAPIGVAALVPTELTVTVDFGDATTATWADTLDGGDEAGSFAGVADGGSAA